MGTVSEELKSSTPENIIWSYAQKLTEEAMTWVGADEYTAKQVAVELGYSATDYKLGSNYTYLLLRGETKQVEDATVYRIVSLVNSKDGTIHAGDKGGFVDETTYLEPCRNGWVYDDAVVIGCHVDGKVQDKAVCVSLEPYSVKDESEHLRIRCTVKDSARVVCTGLVAGRYIDGDSEIEGMNIRLSNGIILHNTKILANDLELELIDLYNCVVKGAGPQQLINRIYRNKQILVSDKGVEINDIQNIETVPKITWRDEAERIASAHGYDLYTSSMTVRNAARNGDFSVVVYLIERGVKIDEDFHAALWEAICIGHLELVKYLVEHGADIHADEEAAIGAAVGSNHLDILRYLVEQGADIHVHREEPLGDASAEGYFSIVKYLVEQGADIHSCDDGPLLLASEFGHLDVVKYLAKHGANIHTHDDEALKLASENGHSEIVKFLKEYSNNEKSVVVEEREEPTPSLSALQALKNLQEGMAAFRSSNDSN